MYDGDHLQGRLQLSDEGEEECIKEKIDSQGKESYSFCRSLTKVKFSTDQVRLH